MYVHQDANYNVTTLTEITGRVLERYFYSPYGQLEAVISSHPFDYDDDGEMDATDVAAADVGGACRGDYSGHCRRPSFPAPTPAQGGGLALGQFAQAGQTRIATVQGGGRPCGCGGGRTGNSGTCSGHCR